MSSHQPADVKWAEISKEPPPYLQGKVPRYTATQRKGVKYEAKAHAYLHGRYYPYYVPAPWFVYRERGWGHDLWCHPDGLLIRPREGIITIVEVKYTHTPKAWWQLVHLYIPVVSAAFGTSLWTYRTAEVVKWYDAKTKFPGHHYLRPDIQAAKSGEVAVMIWSGRGAKPLHSHDDDLSRGRSDLGLGG